MSVLAQTIAPAFEGLDTVSSPDYVTKYKASVLANFLVGKSGKLVLRGGMTTNKRLRTAPDGASFHGLWTLGEKVLVNTDGTTTKWVDVTGGTITAPTTVTATAALGPADVYAEIADAAYGPALTGSPKDFLKWTGTGAPTVVTDAPKDALDAAQFAARLFVLGGTEPGTTTPQKNDRLWWTDPGGPDGNVLADWVDDISGLVNQVILPANGVALARITNALVIFHRNSVSLLQGTGPSTWSVKPVLYNCGLVHRLGVLELGDAVLFLSDRGLYRYDGAENTLLSSDVDTDLRAALSFSNTVRPSLSLLPGGYVHVVVTDDNAGVFTNIFSMALHLESGAWTELSVDPDVMDRGIVVVANTESQSVIYDNNRLWIANPMTDVAVQAPVRDQLSESPNTQAAVPGQWRSRVVALASPNRMAQIKRLLIDYYSESDGWFVTLMDEAGTTLLAEFALASDSTVLNRLRYQTECLADAVAVQAVIEWRGVLTPTVDPPALFDITIEYAATRDRP